MKKIAEIWLSCWLYIIVLISGILIGLLVANWSVWSWQTRLFAMATALLPIHVLEVWRFPGGFHTMYNLMAGSDTPDRYPMNQLSDMWTNFIGVLFGCVVLAVGVNPVFLIMQVFLCCAELFGHLSGGIFAYQRFRSKGKKTIYNPGLFTTLFGYLPILVGIVLSFFTEQTPSILQVVIGLICSAALGAFSLKIVERLCMNRNTPYGYTWGEGYFTKYLSEESAK